MPGDLAQAILGGTQVFSQKLAGTETLQLALALDQQGLGALQGIKMAAPGEETTFCGAGKPHALFEMVPEYLQALGRLCCQTDHRRALVIFGTDTDRFTREVHLIPYHRHRGVGR